jgi:hypothetical protein
MIIQDSMSMFFGGDKASLHPGCNDDFTNPHKYQKFIELHITGRNFIFLYDNIQTSNRKKI